METLKEVFNSIRRNKVRSTLAGFSVAWGIFILMVLLGVGQGFRNGVMDLFSVFAQKSMFVYGGVTSEKFGNMSEGMEVSFNEEYLQALKVRYDEINTISPAVSLTGVYAEHENKSGTYTLSGVGADYFKIMLLEAEDNGRLFNYMDYTRERNVAVIGQGVADNLFNKDDAVDSYLNIEGNYFLVVGVLREDNLYSVQEHGSIFIPYSSFALCFDLNREFSSFSMILNDDTDTKSFEGELKSYIAHKTNFNKNDKSALYIANTETQTSVFESLFHGLELLIWGVGICFLLGGIVGIANIMLIVVKERTNEIGIRKAVGALPVSIITLILSESIVVTCLAGLAGMALGGGALAVIDHIIGSDITEQSIFVETALNLPAIAAALVILIMAGIAAGLFPAIKASQITPVEAIRYENAG